METIMKFMTQSGWAGYAITFVGIAALGLVVERVRTLYFEYAVKTDEFMKQVTGLIMADKTEEAITFCTANKRSPLPHVIKGVLERSDRDDEGIHQGLDIALSEVIPQLGKRLGYLATLANVATLLGLLGTIGGLIMAFDAVSSADPATKQMVLAQGISVAMYTTYMGLIVAIPTMLAYSFLHTKQTRILEEVSEHSGKVVDLLISRHYQPFAHAAAFPRTTGEAELMKKTKNTPPPSNAKAA